MTCSLMVFPAQVRCAISSTSSDFNKQKRDYNGFTSGQGEARNKGTPFPLRPKIPAHFAGRRSPRSLRVEDPRVLCGEKGGRGSYEVPRSDAEWGRSPPEQHGVGSSVRPAKITQSPCALSCPIYLLAASSCPRSASGS